MMSLGGIILRKLFFIFFHTSESFFFYVFCSALFSTAAPHTLLLCVVAKSTDCWLKKIIGITYHQDLLCLCLIDLSFVLALYERKAGGFDLDWTGMSL